MSVTRNYLAKCAGLMSGAPVISKPDMSKSRPASIAFLALTVSVPPKLVSAGKKGQTAGFVPLSLHTLSPTAPLVDAVLVDPATGARSASRVSLYRFVTGDRSVVAIQVARCTIGPRQSELRVLAEPYLLCNGRAIFPKTFEQKPLDRVQDYETPLAERLAVVKNVCLSLSKDGGVFVNFDAADAFVDRSALQSLTEAEIMALALPAERQILPPVLALKALYNERDISELPPLPDSGAAAASDNADGGGGVIVTVQTTAQSAVSEAQKREDQKRQKSREERAVMQFFEHCGVVLPQFSVCVNSAPTVLATKRGLDFLNTSTEALEAWTKLSPLGENYLTGSDEEPAVAIDATIESFTRYSRSAEYKENNNNRIFDIPSLGLNVLVQQVRHRQDLGGNNNNGGDAPPLLQPPVIERFLLKDLYVGTDAMAQLGLSVSDHVQRFMESHPIPMMLVCALRVRETMEDYQNSSGDASKTRSFYEDGVIHAYVRTAHFRLEEYVEQVGVPVTLAFVTAWHKATAGWRKRVFAYLDHVKRLGIGGAAAGGASFPVPNPHHAVTAGAVIGWNTLNEAPKLPPRSEVPRIAAHGDEEEDPKAADAWRYYALVLDGDDSLHRRARARLGAIAAGVDDGDGNSGLLPSAMTPEQGVAWLEGHALGAANMVTPPAAGSGGRDDKPLEVALPKLVVFAVPIARRALRADRDAMLRLKRLVSPRPPLPPTATADAPPYDTSDLVLAAAAKHANYHPPSADTATNGSNGTTTTATVQVAASVKRLRENDDDDDDEEEVKAAKPAAAAAAADDESSEATRAARRRKRPRLTAPSKKARRERRSRSQSRDDEDEEEDNNGADTPGGDLMAIDEDEDDAVMSDDIQESQTFV